MPDSSRTTFTPRRRLGVVALGLAAAAVGPSAVAQDAPPWECRYGAFEQRYRDDSQELLYSGGVRFVYAAQGLDVRCDRAMLVLDRTHADEQLRALERREGLPRRDAPLPAPRRSVDDATIRARVASFLHALRSRPTVQPAAPFDLELFRSIYLEGDVAVIVDGLEVLRCDSLVLAPLDDRLVLRNVVMRLRQRTAAGQDVMFTVRSEELTRQDGRFFGRNVSITTSTAGEAQFDVLSSDVVIRELEDEFAIDVRGNELRIHGRTVMPLPDQRIYSKTQDQLLIKSVSAGWSDRLGAQARIVWGSTFNDLGGALHESLTGRPADEFRGTWRLGTGWVQERGFPIDGELDYRGGDLWHGRTYAFGLDDAGTPIGPITQTLGGAPIGSGGRSLVHTENRVHLSERTDLDLSLFDATDPSIWAEFQRGRYYEDERPETSAHLRHRGEGWLATITGRTNLTNFSYADGRELSTRFVGEEPYATLDFFSVPLAELGDDTPLLLSSSTGAGRLRSDWSEGATAMLDDGTWRFDQEFELAVPLRFDGFGLRPFAGARFTGYERTAIGGSHGRTAFVGGAELGTRLARTFELDGGGARRHEIVPTIRWENRFDVQRAPSDFFQFDSVDALAERQVVRFGVLQRLLSRTPVEGGDAQIREDVWLDLAQNVLPTADRDNGGDALGLFEFELLVRSVRLADDVSLGFLVEGEQNWNTQELRTLNLYTELTTGDVSWLLQYRTDEVEDGLFGYGISLPIRRRWQVQGTAGYDIARNRSAYYSASLVRNDLDWRLIFGLNYDVVTDDTTFIVDFEPRLGGLAEMRERWGVSGYEYGRSRGSVLDY